MSADVRITEQRFVGKRVRKTVYYPERSPACPAVAWTYEGTVTKVRDVAAGAGREWRRYQGEFHVTLTDVTVTPDPPLQGARHEETVVLLGHEPGWAIVGHSGHRKS